MLERSLMLSPNANTVLRGTFQGPLDTVPCSGCYTFTPGWWSPCIKVIRCVWGSPSPQASGMPKNVVPAARIKGFLPWDGGWERPRGKAWKEKHPLSHPLTQTDAISGRHDTTSLEWGFSTHLSLHPLPMFYNPEPRTLSPRGVKCSVMERTKEYMILFSKKWDYVPSVQLWPQDIFSPHVEKEHHETSSISSMHSHAQMLGLFFSHSQHNTHGTHMHF